MKVYDHSTYTRIIIKKFFTIFFTAYENEWEERKFQSQKILKSDFYKNKKVFKIDNINVNKILVSKEEPYATKIYSNTLLDTMIIILLNHYA